MVWNRVNKSCDFAVVVVFLLSFTEVAIVYLTPYPEMNLDVS